MRGWVALGAFAAGVVLGLLMPASRPATTVSGCLIVLSLLLVLPWTRWRRRMAPMQLFDPVGRGQRWCDRCAHAAPAAGPCLACGHRPPEKRARRKERRKVPRQEA